MKNQIPQVRNVLAKFTPLEITACLEAQIHSGCNQCIKTKDEMLTTDILTKADYIYDLVKQGYTINTAIRKLGEQIRLLTSAPANTATLPYLSTQAPLKMN